MSAAPLQQDTGLRSGNRRLRRIFRENHDGAMDRIWLVCRHCRDKTLVSEGTGRDGDHARDRQIEVMRLAPTGALHSGRR